MTNLDTRHYHRVDVDIKPIYSLDGTTLMWGAQELMFVVKDDSLFLVTPNSSSPHRFVARLGGKTPPEVIRHYVLYGKSAIRNAKDAPISMIALPANTPQQMAIINSMYQEFDKFDRKTLIEFLNFANNKGSKTLYANVWAALSPNADKQRWKREETLKFINKWVESQSEKEAL